MGCYRAVERLDPLFFVVDSCKEVCIPLHKHHPSHSLEACRASSAWPRVSPLAVLVTNSSLGAVLAKELLALEGLTLRDAWHKSPVGLRACSSLADWPGTRSSRKIPWRRAWQPTPVFPLGESHGQRRLAGYTGDWRDHTELDTTEAT